MTFFTEPATDDALDNKLGLQCDSGRFQPPSGGWPAADLCEVVDTCKFPFLEAPASSYFKPTGLTLNDELPKGSSVFFICQDSQAILDTGKPGFLFDISALSETLILFFENQ